MYMKVVYSTRYKVYFWKHRGTKSVQRLLCKRYKKLKLILGNVLTLVPLSKTSDKKKVVGRTAYFDCFQGLFTETVATCS